MKLFEITKAPYRQSDDLPEIMGTLVQDAASLACDDVRFDLVIQGGRHLRWFLAVHCRLADPQQCSVAEAVLARSIEERFRSSGHRTEPASQSEFAAITGACEVMRALVREHTVYRADLSPMPYMQRGGLHRAQLEHVLSLLRDTHAQLVFQICPTHLSAREQETVRERAVSYMNAAQMLANRDQTAADAANDWADIVTGDSTPFALAGIFVRGTQEETAALTARLKSVYRQLSGEAVPFNNLNLPGDDYPDLWKLSPALFHTSEGRLTGLYTPQELDLLCPIPAVEENFCPLPGNVSSMMERRLIPGKFTSGEGIRLGVSDGQAISLPLHTTAKSLFVGGETGSGKSTASQTIVQQLTERGIPCIVITPAKDWRLTARRAGMNILRMGDPHFRLNPFLLPCGVALRDYKPLLTQFFEGCIAMGSDGSPLPSLFQETTDRVYSRFNYTASTRGGTGEERFGFSEFMELYHSNVDDSSYDGELSGNLRSAGAFRINKVASSQTFDSIHGMTPEALLEGSGTLIELDSNEYVSRAVASILLIQVLSFIRATPADHDRPLRAVILVDEAHRLLDSTTDHSTQENQNASTMMQTLFRNAVSELRKERVGTILIDQSINRMPPALIEACGTKLIFRLTGREAEAASRTIGVPPRVFSHMETGEAVVTSSGLPPTLLATMDRPNGTLSDREVETYMASRIRPPVPQPFKACCFCAGCKDTCCAPVRETAEMLAQKIQTHRRKDGPLTEVKLQLLCEAIPKILRRHGYSDPRLPPCVAIQLCSRTARLTGVTPRYGMEHLIKTIEEIVEEEGGFGEKRSF